MTAPSPPTAEPPAAPVRVRRARPDDAATVQALLLELADHENSGHAVRVTVENWSRLLADPRVVVLLAVDDEMPVGYVSAVHQLNLWNGRDILALDDIYVRPTHRNQSVGRLLMAALADHAAAHGHLLIRWELEHANDSAARFYRRLGATLRPKVIATWQPHDYRTHRTAEEAR